ncbi:MAG: hypothetical protein A2Z18_08020 [Armatimonadetes bacterium RBG_16_58_9]|nr:MAG: hypothetical protein A2Z18_08020 [Armatimonadetes bacterium RBG_16_58_9]
MIHSEDRTSLLPKQRNHRSGRFAIWPEKGNQGICDPLRTTFWEDAGITGITNPEIAREGPDFKSGPREAWRPSLLSTFNFQLHLPVEGQS